MVEMEIKEAEKIVIAKPVASRPSSSSFGSFTELRTGAINASQSKSCSATAVTVIRSKTLTLKPVADHISAEVVSAQTEISQAAVCFPSATSDSKSNVVYRPMAKRASSTTISASEHSGSSNAISQLKVAEIEANVQELRDVPSLPKLASKLHQDSQFQSEENEPKECSKPTSDTLAECQKSLQQTIPAGRLSSDGYNWRKYGQKLVKGSEYPRSYYKCTHPNCPVKKKVERSVEGKIVEIVYKGEHNHSKPQTFRPGLSDRQRLRFVSEATDNETNNLPWNKKLRGKNESYEGKVENENEVGSSGRSTHSSSIPSLYDPEMTAEFHPDVNVDDNSFGLHEVCNEVTVDVEGDGDGHKGKRRKNQNQLDELDISGEGTEEKRIIVKNPSDSEIIGDGFHWRKYGQKVVKGNPRSYYRCTSLECNVRKYVERTSDDPGPGACITTYEGKHNHDMPNKTSRRRLR